MRESLVNSARESRHLLRFLREDRLRRQAALADCARRADRIVRDSRAVLTEADRVIREAFESVRRD